MRVCTIHLCYDRLASQFDRLIRHVLPNATAAELLTSGVQLPHQNEAVIVPGTTDMVEVRSFGKTYRARLCRASDLSGPTEKRLRAYYAADFDAHRDACKPGALERQLRWLRRGV